MNILEEGSGSQLGATNGHVTISLTRPPLPPARRLSASPTPESVSDFAPYSVSVRFSCSRTSTSTGSYQSSQFFGSEATSETETKSVSLLSSTGWGVDERPREDTHWNPRANYVGLNVSSLPQPTTRMASILPTERNPSPEVKLLLLRYYLLWRGRMWESRISRSRHVVVTTPSLSEVDTKFEAGTQAICANATLRTAWCVLACLRKPTRADDSKLSKMEMSTSLKSVARTTLPKVTDAVHRSEEGVKRKQHAAGTKSGLGSSANNNSHEAVSKHEERFGNRFVALGSSTSCVAKSCMADLICEGLPPHRAPEEEEGLRRHRIPHASRTVLGKPRTSAFVHSALIKEQLRIQGHFHSRNPCAVVYAVNEPYMYCSKLGMPFAQI